MTDAPCQLLAAALALGAALGFYQAQTRRQGATSRRRWLAVAAGLGLLLSLGLFGHAAGPVAGPCYGLIVLMLATVALPYANAWRGARHGHRR